MTNPSPAITFSVDLTPLSNEAIGPNTSATTTAVLSPDMYQGADNGTAARANRKNLVSTLLPSLQVSPDRVLKHGDTFTEYGTKAVYLRKMYAVGYAPAERAYLTVTSVV
jgi:hypothetical protein